MEGGTPFLLIHAFPAQSFYRTEQGLVARDVRAFPFPCEIVVLYKVGELLQYPSGTGLLPS